MRSVLKAIVATLAVANTAYAACKGCSDDCKVEATGDETPIGSCTTFKGSISVEGEGVNSLDFGSIRTIQGDLIISNCSNLATISAPELTTIEGEFRMFALTRLSNLAMGSLQTVGKILFQTLPALTALGTRITECNDVVISDTNLGTLDGITLKSGGLLDINNNNYLGAVNMAGLKFLDTALNIAFNGKSTGKKLAATFSNMTWARNATFRDVNLISLPALITVNGSIGFYNDTFSTLACPNLATIGESLSIDDCSQLTNVSFPKLTKIGGTFQIANNTVLETIDGFPKVASVGGAVDFSGSFKNASLPALTNVDGGFNLQTTEEFDCSAFTTYQSNGVIRGEGFDCSGKVTNPGTKDSPTQTGSGTSPSSTKKPNAAPKSQLSVGLVAVAAIGGLFMSL